MEIRSVRCRARSRRNLCQSVHDDICVARTYRVNGNRLTCTGQYWRATAVFEKALAIARQWENWPEISKLQQGMDAALEGLGNAYPPLSIGISPPFSKPPQESTRNAPRSSPPPVDRTTQCHRIQYRKLPDQTRIASGRRARRSMLPCGFAATTTRSARKP